MKPTLLAVDLSYQTYRACAAHAKLTFDGEFTGGLYGFLVTLAKQIREVSAGAVIICSDVKPYLRSTTYPQYKQLRKKNADDDLLQKFIGSVPTVVEAMQTIGIPVVGFQGFEADDCIGWLVRQHRHRFQQIYAASNDSDLYQLLEYPNFRVMRGSEMSDVITRQMLDITPEQFMLMNALQGTHNDVAGIPGVGQVTALKMIRNPGLLRQAMERHGDLVERNMALQRLPYPGFPHAPVPSMGRFNQRALYKFCGRFDIEVSQSMIDSFSRVCP